MLEFISPGIENNSKYYGKGSKDKVDSMQEPGNWWVSREKQILRTNEKEVVEVPIQHAYTGKSWPHLFPRTHWIDFYFFLISS